jgi:hypothetical protein
MVQFAAARLSPDLFVLSAVAPQRFDAEDAARAGRGMARRRRSSSPRADLGGPGRQPNDHRPARFGASGP